jgi:hypothetical protein
MASEFRPLAEILRELKALVQQKTSGFFFIATDSNNSSIIRLRNGQIDDVAFSRYHSDEAVQHLARVAAARARFQPGPTTPSNRVPLSEATLQWLLGGFEGGTPAWSAARPAAPSAAPGTPPAEAPDQRATVERVALNYLGPIAPLLCDEAFAEAGDVEGVLAQLAANMATEEEAGQFMAEARAALGLGPGG